MRKEEKDLITTAQASDILRLTVATVNKRAKAGLIPPVRKLPGLTGAYLFDPDVIERIAAERRPDTAA